MRHLLALLSGVAVGLACGEEAPPADAPPAIGRITIVGAPHKLDVGASAQVDVAVVDAAGRPLPNAVVLLASSNERALATDGTRTITARAPGYHTFVAYHGAVQSEPAFVLVTAPRPVTRAPAIVRVSLPPEVGSRPLTLDLVPTGADALQLGAGGVEVEVITSRNQMLAAVDADGETLLLKLARGSTPEAGPEADEGPVTLDFGSTAEALAVVAAGVPFEDPEALAAVRVVLDGDPRLAALAEELAARSRDGASWANDTAALAQSIAVAAEALAPFMAEAARRGRPEPLKADDPGDNQFSVVPDIDADQVENDSGLQVALIPCATLPDAPAGGQPDPLQDVRSECETVAPALLPQAAVLSVANWRLRQVAIYLDPADGKSSVGPIMVGSMTYASDFWTLVVSLFSGASEGEVPQAFASPASTRRLVYFGDVGNTDAIIYRMNVYGPGARAPIIPGYLYDADAALGRSLLPWFLTFATDYFGQLANLLGGAEDLFGNADDATLEAIGTWLGRIGTYESAQSAAYATFVQAWQGENVAGMIAAMLDLLWTLEGEDLDALAEIFGAGFEKAETVKKHAAFMGRVMTWYNVAVGAVNTSLAAVDFAVTRRVAMFTLRGGAKTILTPADHILPDAFIGCAWSTTIEAAVDVGLEAPFWAHSPDQNPAGGWRFIDGSSVLVIERDEAHPMTLADGPTGSGSITVTLHATHKGQPSALLEHAVFTYALKPADAVLEELLFGDSPPAGFAPGAALPLVAWANVCNVRPSVTAIQARGAALAAPVDLQQEGSDAWKGQALVARPLSDDRPAEVVIELTNRDGHKSVVTRTMTVANAPPEVPAMPPIAVFPDFTFTPEITVEDPNFDGTRIAEVPAGTVRIVDANGLATTPPLGELVFEWDEAASDPTTGRIRLRATRAVTVAIPTPDNDGGLLREAAPHALGLALTDDDGASPTGAAALRVVVTNRPPRIVGTPSTLNLGASPPSSFTLRVEDDNGGDDIGSPTIVGDNPGFAPANAERDERSRTFTYAFDPGALATACATGCQVVFVAKDMDDPPENGGESAPFTLLVTVGDFHPCSETIACPTRCTPAGVLEARACVEGACADFAPVENCASDGRVCHPEGCRDACIVPGDCNAGAAGICDNDVAAAFRCEAGTCVESRTECAATGKVCHQGACIPPCASDAGCPGSCFNGTALRYTCDANLHVCTESSATPCGTLACHAATGTCAPTCPGGDADCPPPFCAGADAVASYHCDAGACVTSETACADGTVCDADNAKCIGKCQGPADCPDDCSNGAARQRTCSPTGTCEVMSETACQAPYECVDAACAVPCGAGVECPAQQCDSVDGILTARIWHCGASGLCEALDTVCGQDETCDGGNCQAACDDDLDCPYDCDALGRLRQFECSVGRCTTLQVAACEAGETCKLGFCLAACDGDADCPDGGATSCPTPDRAVRYACEGGACVERATMCDPSQVCPPGGSACIARCDGSCPTGCSDDAMAVVLATCDGDGLCQPEAPSVCPAATPRCAGGTCIEPCTRESDCQGGGTSRCLDADLQVTRVCADGRCDDEVVSCAARSGTCQEDRCVGQTCDDDADCPSRCSVLGIFSAGVCQAGTCDVAPPDDCSVGDRVCTDEGCSARCEAPADCSSARACDAAGGAIRGETCGATGVCEGVTLVDCAAEGLGCEGAVCTGGSCCVAHPVGGGCDDSMCAELVVAAEPACAASWTATCVERAVALCDVCAECLDDQACDDAIACTEDHCVDRICTHTPDDSACDDTSECSTERCDVALGCRYVATGAPCCHQSVVTTATCEPDGCTFAADEDCDAGGQVCLGGACVTHGGVCCESHGGIGCDDAACETLVCDLEPRCCTLGWTATCGELAQAQCPVLCPECTTGLECGDGVDCTVDACEGGQCVNTPDAARCADGTLCTSDTCDAQAGCTHAAGAPCCVGDVVTTASCAGGVCALVPGQDCGGLDRRCGGGACVECLSVADCPEAPGVRCDSAGAISTACVDHTCTTRLDYDYASAWCVDQYFQTRVTGTTRDGFVNVATPRYQLGCPEWTYCVEVAGTWSAYAGASWDDVCGGVPVGSGNTRHGSDALYAFAYPDTSALCLDPEANTGEDLPYPFELIQLAFSANGNLQFTPDAPEFVTPDWIDSAYAESHAYQFEVSAAPEEWLYIADVPPDPLVAYGQVSNVIRLGPCAVGPAAGTPYAHTNQQPLCSYREDVGFDVDHAGGTQTATTTTSEPVLLVSGPSLSGDAPSHLLVFHAAELQVTGADAGLVVFDLEVAGQAVARSLQGFTNGGWELRDAGLLHLSSVPPGARLTSAIKWSTSAGTATASWFGGTTHLHDFELGDWNDDFSAFTPFPVWSVERTNPVSTTLGSWQVVPSMELDVATAGGPLWVLFFGSGMHVIGSDLGAAARFRLLIDGTERTFATHEFRKAGGQARDIAFFWLETPPAGTHHIAVEWANGFGDSVPAGTFARISELGATRSLVATELVGADGPMRAWQATRAGRAESTVVDGTWVPIPGLTLDALPGDFVALFKAGGVQITDAAPAQIEFGIFAHDTLVTSWKEEFFGGALEARDAWNVATVRINDAFSFRPYPVEVRWRGSAGRRVVGWSDDPAVLQLIEVTP